jgi:hypothetical protein
MRTPIKLPEKSFSHPATELMAGDIVFFTMNPVPVSFLTRLSDKFVKLVQSFLQNKGGHKNISHVGLMIDEKYLENGLTKTRLRIAHLLWNTYKVEDPDAYISKRTTIVYRPKNLTDRKA